MQSTINAKTNMVSFASYLSLNTADFFVFHGIFHINALNRSVHATTKQHNCLWLYSVIRPIQMHVLLACQLHCPLFLHITPPLTPSFFQLVPLFFFIHFSPSPFLSLPLFRPHSSLHINTFVITHLIPPATLHSPSNTSTEAHKGEKKRTKEHFCDFVPCLNKLAVAKYSVLL